MFQRLLNQATSGAQNVFTKPGTYPVIQVGVDVNTDVPHVQLVKLVEYVIGILSPVVKT